MGGVIMVKKTHEQFLQQMQKVNKNIEILSKYEKVASEFFTRESIILVLFLNK